MSSSPKIETLQAGRALAAFAVVIHHAGLAASSFGQSFFGQSILERGYLGVDFFFVLSGFIIFESTADGQKSLADYVRARFQRVYLPYWPIGLGIALLYSLFPTISTVTRDWSWLPTLFLLPVASSPALSVAWTLQHEILFYTIFGLGFFGRSLTIGLGLWGLAIIVAWIGNPNNVLALAPINLEFLMGVGIAVMRRKGWGSAGWLMLAPIPFVIWLVLNADRNLSFLVGASFALAMLPIIKLEQDGNIRVYSWLSFWGAASYSLYLVHGLAISIFVRLLPTTNVVVILFVAIGASLLAGGTYHLLVERPILRFWSTKRKKIN